MTYYFTLKVDEKVSFRTVQTKDGMEITFEMSNKDKLANLLSNIKKQFKRSMELLKLEREVEFSSQKVNSLSFWSSKIKERDNYKCQNKFCRNEQVLTAMQIDIEPYLESHHIVSRSRNSKFELDINNGITLCKWCHKDFHNIFGKNVGSKQLQTYFDYMEKYPAARSIISKDELIPLLEQKMTNNALHTSSLKYGVFERIKAIQQREAIK